MSNRQLPITLESPRGKLVYLSLERERATVSELHARLGVPRITLYSVLKTLQSRGLVDRDGRAYVTARPV
jgi:DNA-binding IclR family transcriptional regulator